MHAVILQIPDSVLRPRTSPADTACWVDGHLERATDSSTIGSSKYNIRCAHLAIKVSLGSQLTNTVVLQHRFIALKGLYSWAEGTAEVKLNIVDDEYRRKLVTAGNRLNKSQGRRHLIELIRMGCVLYWSYGLDNKP